MFGRSSFTLAAIVFLFEYGQLIGAEPGNRSRENRSATGSDIFKELVRQSNAAMRKHNFDESIAKLTAALEMKPDPKNAALVHLGRAEAFDWKNDLARAQQDAEAAIQLDPNFANPHFADGHFWLGLIYQTRGDNNRAIAEYTTAIRLNPGFAPSYNNRGEAYMALGQRDKALTDLNEAVRRKLRSLITYSARASVYEKLNMTDRALADYRVATTLAPSDAEERATRGLAFFELADYRSAAADFAQAKKELPRSDHVLNSSAWFKATCSDATFRNGAEALRDSKTACELTKWKDANKLDTYAAACAEVGNYEDALKYGTQAIRLRGSSANTEMEEHLHCYQQYRPYREKPRSAQ